MGGGVFGAAVHLVNARLRVVLVGFAGDSRIDGKVVFVATAGHADVGHGPAGAIAHNRPADAVLVRAADGHALSESHCAGVAEGDVFAQVVALEDDAGPIGEPLSDDPTVCGVDADHAAAVAVEFAPTNRREPPWTAGVTASTNGADTPAVIYRRLGGSRAIAALDNNVDAARVVG